MAEIIQKDGTWTFDGDTVRIAPGRDKVPLAFDGERIRLEWNWKTDRAPRVLPAPAPAAPSGGGPPRRAAAQTAELGDLRDAGILTEDAFGTAKQAILKRL